MKRSYPEGNRSTRSKLAATTNGSMRSHLTLLIIFVRDHSFVKWVVGIIVGITFIEMAANVETHREKIAWEHVKFADTLQVGWVERSVKPNIYRGARFRSSTQPCIGDMLPIASAVRNSRAELNA